MTTTLAGAESAGAAKATPALSPEAAAAVRAAEAFAQAHDRMALIRLFGTFEDMISDEEFERLRSGT